MTKFLLLIYIIFIKCVEQNPKTGENTGIVSNGPVNTSENALVNTAKVDILTEDQSEEDSAETTGGAGAGDTIEEEIISNEEVESTAVDVAAKKEVLLPQPKNIFVDSNYVLSGRQLTPEHFNRDIKKSYSQDELIEKVLHYLTTKYMIHDDKPYKEALKTFYTFFDGNINKIAIALAHSIFTTSGFTRLVNLDTSMDRYGCKGVLQFYGEANYKLASDNFDFVAFPEEMGKLKKEAVLGSLQGYVKINPGDLTDYFFESLVGLNPTEVQVLNLRREHKHERIVERVKILLEVKNVLNTPVMFTQSGRNVPVEIVEVLKKMKEIESVTTFDTDEAVILL